MHAILREHLEEILIGRLPRPLQPGIETHLSQCAKCRRELEEARESSRLMRLLRAEDAPEPGPGFSVQVLQHIEALETATPWWKLWPALRQLAFAALMFLLLLGGYYFTFQAANRDTTAELLLDTPVEREAPALLVSHQHSNPDGMCLQCWQQKQAAPQAADAHLRRERVMVTLVSAQAGD